jgi:hypothetical protein
VLVRVLTLVLLMLLVRVLEWMLVL